MANVQPPSCFWPSTISQPFAASWFQWKTSFVDYIGLLDEFSTTLPLSENSKLKLLRHNLGDEGQKLFDALDLRTSPSLADAFTALDRSWGTHSNVFTCRFKFSQLRQEPGETLENFITRLMQGIRFCDYSTIPQKKFERTLLTQQLIVGISDNSIRECLLSEDSSKLTWERCCDIARAKVDARQQNKLFSVESPTVHLSKLQVDTSQTSRTSRCFRCGSISHRANYPQCPARNCECRKCGKRAHFAKCCRSVQVAELTVSAEDDPSVTAEQEVVAIGTNPLHSINHVIEPKLPNSDIRTVYFCAHTLEIPVQMDLDSASPITTISRTFYDTYLCHLPINPSVYSFGSYTGNSVPVCGFIMVSIRVLDASANVAVYVTSSVCKPLVDRNAMIALQITPSIDPKAIRINGGVARKPQKKQVQSN